MIGILDSGSGGLSVMRALREVLPSSDIIYFGDIKNAPYGSKSREELSQLTVQSLERLKQHGAQRIVSACNSVSASLAISLFDAFEIKPEALIEMVGPTVSYFRGVEARVAVCATPATIKSGMYENAFHMIGQDTISIAISDLAGAIEFGADKKVVKEIIVEALQPYIGQFDVLILACTHYPLVREVFVDVVDDGVKIFDPAYAVAERAKKLFWPQEVSYGTTRFLLSQKSEQFEKFVQQLFPDMTYTLEVVD